MRDVLIVDGAQRIGLSLKRRLETTFEVAVRLVDSHAQALDLIERDTATFAVALLDLNLSGPPAGHLIEALASKGIPFVVLTEESEEELLESMPAGILVDCVVNEGNESIAYAVDLVGRIARNSGVQVLVATPSAVDRQRAAALLHARRCAVLDARDGVEALDLLRKHPDTRVVVTDFHFPDMDAYELTRHIRAKHSRDDLVVIGMASRGDSRATARFIKSGATDVIERPFSNAEFHGRLTRAIQALERADLIRTMSHVDELTGVGSRHHFLMLGRMLFENACRGHLAATVAMVDIDNFQEINELYGRRGGDVVLCQVGDIVKRRFRKSDIVARFGDDTFCILATNLDILQTERIFDKLRAAVALSPVQLGGETVSVTVSVGVCARLMGSLDEMLRKAVDQQRDARRRGGNRVMLTMADRPEAVDTLAQLEDSILETPQ
jgi:diguanylate cyclase (GGDEF)-like protein